MMKPDLAMSNMGKKSRRRKNRTWVCAFYPKLCARYNSKKLCERPPRDTKRKQGGRNRQGEVQIGRILHLKSEISKLRLIEAQRSVQFEISDFGFEMQDSSNLNFPLPVPS